MSPKGITRKRRGFAKLGVAGATVVASAIFAAPASAALSIPELEGLPGLNPQTTNVPTLLWNGQEAKLVSCSPAISSVPIPTQSAEWETKKFSGSGLAPIKPENGTTFFSPSGSILDDQGCVKATFDSIESGLAIIHLNVAGLPVVLDGGLEVADHEETNNGINLVDHDFLVGWMDFNKPTLEKVDDPGDGNDTYDSGVNSHADGIDFDAGDGGPMPLSHEGGPYGEDDVVAEHPDSFQGADIIAGEGNARMTSDVTGTMPVRSGFVQNNALGSELNMPEDWAKLASVLATDQDTDVRGAARQLRWDVHDDRLRTDDNCDPATVDAVSNCVKTLSVLGGFSRNAPSLNAHDGSDDPLGYGLLGSLTIDGEDLSAMIGPFDSLLPDNTLLNNGVINAADAPMPPADIRYELTGIGSLEDASKPDAYSRDGEAGFLTVEDEENLYAPFYATVPSATLRGLVAEEASGNASAVLSNNFPGLGSFPGASGLDGEFGGLLSQDAIYPYWLLANKDGRDATDNGCKSGTGPGKFAQFDTPSGTDAASLINDEQGETQAEFNPGMGFENPVSVNRNGGCDLQDVDVLGESEITATARSPYHQSGIADATSDPISYEVKSLWSRSLTDTTKGEGVENSVARIVTAHAQDIDGSPVANEIVCWMGDSDAEGIRRFSGDVPAAGVIDVKPALGGAIADENGEISVVSDGTPDPFDGLGRTCTRTDENGNAAVEVFNSNGGEVNMIAEFVKSGILRHRFVDFGEERDDDQGPAGPVGPQGPQGPQGPKGEDGEDGTTPPPPTVIREVIAAQNAQSDAAPVSAASLQVSSARPSAGSAAKYAVSGRVVRSGKRSFVRVYAQGAKGKVKLRLKLQNRRGKTLKTVTVTVSANKRTTLRSLSVSKKVAKVSVSVA